MDQMVNIIPLQRFVGQTQVKTFSSQHYQDFWKPPDCIQMDSEYVPKQQYCSE